MKEPTIMKAMEYLDKDLIAKAAERKAAPRFNKKKVLVLLAACFLMVITFVMMGTETEPTLPPPEELWYEMMDWHIEQNQDNPDMLAYYTKWREVGYDALNPWPDEWQNEDGTFKEFVTSAMIREVYDNSPLLQEYYTSDPTYGGRDVTIEFFFSDRRHLCVATSFMGSDE